MSDRLRCPVCNEPCTTIPPCQQAHDECEAEWHDETEPSWCEDRCGICQCGALLTVYCDDDYASLRERESVWCEGEWTTPFDDDDGSIAAVITYAEEPSPETGHVGWCWWALGKVGDAPSFAEAQRRAGAVVMRRLLEDEVNRG